MGTILLEWRYKRNTYYYYYCYGRLFENEYNSATLSSIELYVLSDTFLIILVCSVNNRRTLSTKSVSPIYSIICLKSVDVRRMQLAFLAQFPREMYQTDRIHPRYFLL